MNTPMTWMTPAPALQAGLAAALIATLAACGGGADADGASMRTAAATTLLDDEGQAMPSVVAPPDRQARTRAGRYATPEQAQGLQRALGARLHDVDADAAGGVERALQMAPGTQAAAHPGTPVAVLVRAADPRVAAAAAERLADAGHDPVFVVVR